MNAIATKLLEESVGKFIKITENVNQVNSGAGISPQAIYFVTVTKLNV